MISKENNACKPGRWQILKQQLNNLAPDAFLQMYNQEQDPVLLDVRTSEELALQPPLQGAKHISYLSADLWAQLDCLDRANVYFVYCQTGRRSVRVCTLMRNGQFDPKKIYNLDGGLNALGRSQASQL